MFAANSVLGYGESYSYLPSEEKNDLPSLNLAHLSLPLSQCLSDLNSYLEENSIDNSTSIDTAPLLQKFSIEEESLFILIDYLLNEKIRDQLICCVETGLRISPDSHAFDALLAAGIPERHIEEISAKIEGENHTFSAPYLDCSTNFEYKEEEKNPVQNPYLIVPEMERSFFSREGLMEEEGILKLPSEICRKTKQGNLYTDRTSAGSPHLVKFNLRDADNDCYEIYNEATQLNNLSHLGRYNSNNYEFARLLAKIEMPNGLAIPNSLYQRLAKDLEEKTVSVRFRVFANLPSSTLNVVTHMRVFPTANRKFNGKASVGMGIFCPHGVKSAKQRPVSFNQIAPVGVHVHPAKGDVALSPNNARLDVQGDVDIAHFWLAEIYPDSADISFNLLLNREELEQIYCSSLDEFQQNPNGTLEEFLLALQDNEALKPIYTSLKRQLIDSVDEDKMRSVVSFARLKPFLDQQLDCSQGLNLSYFIKNTNTQLRIFAQKDAGRFLCVLEDAGNMQKHHISSLQKALEDAHPGFIMSLDYLHPLRTRGGLFEEQEIQRYPDLEGFVQAQLAEDRISTKRYRNATTRALLQITADPNNACVHYSLLEGEIAPQAVKNIQKALKKAGASYIDMHDGEYILDTSFEVS